MANIKQIKVGNITYDIDAVKFDSKNSTYYLNYNNLTNKPTIPAAVQIVDLTSLE